MDQDNKPVSRPTPVVVFVLVAIVLIALLFGGLLFGKQLVANLKKNDTVAVSPDKTPKIEKSKGQNPANQKKDDKTNQKKSAEDKKQEQAATNSDNQSPDSGAGGSSPEDIAATGPEGALGFVLAIFGLGYAGAMYFVSRKQLKAWRR